MTSIRKTIQVRERGSASIIRDDHRFLDDNAQFLRLTEGGIFSLEHSGRSVYGIRAGPHVGQALIGDVLIKVEEKVKGSLAALLGIAESPEARLIEATSFAEAEEIVLYALIDRFMSLVDRYLTYGREKEYLTRRARGGLPRGKTLMPDTMRLWATGRTDMVVFRYQELTPRTFLNQLIGFALHVADAVLVLSEASRRRRVRTASILFEDVGWQELLSIPRANLDLRCADLRLKDPETKSLAVIARLLALHFGVATAVTNERVPFSWFVNLESLFEECVLKACAAAAREAGWRATAWRAAKRYVFASGKSYRAEPDVVLWRATSPSAILDAKYKDLVGASTTPDNADIYQLIAHARAWNVTRAALVYPASETAYKSLGTDASGIEVGYFFFDISKPIEAGRAILKRFAQDA